MVKVYYRFGFMGSRLWELSVQEALCRAETISDWANRWKLFIYTGIEQLNIWMTDVGIQVSHCLLEWEVTYKQGMKYQNC